MTSLLLKNNGKFDNTFVSFEKKNIYRNTVIIVFTSDYLKLNKVVIVKYFT